MREKDLKENGLADMAYKVEKDHEVQMARGDLYKIAKYGIKLHEMLKGVSEEQGLDGWVQAKITKAADYLGSVYHHLDYEMKFDEVTESKKADKFEPHMMYDPKTGKGYKANKEQDHKDMAKKGYTHDKPKKADIKEEADDKDPDTTFVRWLKSNYDKSPKDLNADEYAKMSKKFQASKKDESYVDTLAHKLEEAKKKGLYHNVNKNKEEGKKPRKQGAKGAPSAQDWKDAAKTAKKESVEANCPKCGNPSWKTLDETEKKKGTHGKACWDGHRRGEGNSCHAVKPRKKKK
tara:strand:- start:126 stop:998 length:873 start_codon:yes stop_codon:yes gene_type:complete